MNSVGVHYAYKAIPQDTRRNRYKLSVRGKMSFALMMQLCPFTYHPANIDVPGPLWKGGTCKPSENNFAKIACDRVFRFAIICHNHFWPQSFSVWGWWNLQQHLETVWNSALRFGRTANCVIPWSMRCHRHMVFPFDGSNLQHVGRPPNMLHQI